MKKVSLLISLFLLFNETNAQTNYYISNSGNDSYTGTSVATPWQTISKLNTVTYSSGDSVFFKSGDVFKGQITVNQSGVVFTSYGAGAKPIISGADTISTTWTSPGTINGFTYYETPYSSTPKSFFANNNEQSIARYPNDYQYLTLDSAQLTYLKDNSLTSISASLITGAKLCVHSQQWCWELTAVSALSGDKITFTSPTEKIAKNKYSYFLYDKLTHLDTVNEWKYDGGMIKYIPPVGQNPNSMICLASVYSNGIVVSASASNISIVNLAFEKQTDSGILISSNTNTNIKINNCYFRHQFNYGVNDKGRYNEIYNSFFREVNGLAIYVNGSAFKSTIHHNTFRNIGPFRNYGVGKEINLSAIKISFRDSCHIHHNDIDSAGYCGISVDGKYNLIERNIIKNAMLKNNDGAALKSFGSASQYNVFKNNFVSLSDGNTEGTFSADFVTPAIYFDFSTNNCTIQENTIYNRTKKGIFQNSANHHNTVIGNVVHRASIGIDLNGSPVISSPYMTNMVVKHNSFFALDNNSYIIRQIDHSGTNNIGVVDSNYYFQPFNVARYALLPPSTYYNFAQWQAYGFDANTKSSFVSWTYPTRYDTLLMNQTDNVTTINLGTTKYLDLDSNDVCNSITLQPYTSKILINTGTVCATNGITENEIFNTIRVYPNPCTDEINIDNFQKTTFYSFEIVDVYGKVVVNQQFNSNMQTISTKDLSKGIYFIVFIGDKTYYVSKIIKE